MDGKNMWYENRNINNPKDFIKRPERPRRLQRFLGLVAKTKDEETKRFLEDITLKELNKKVRIKEGLVFIENPETGIEEVLSVYEYCKRLADEIQGVNKK